MLLNAWQEVARSTDAQLILVGEGEDRPSLENQARELGIADRVHLTGRVANPEEFLRSGSVFVLPSVAEGMSNSLLEAMATGLPCLASNIGGNSDLIEPGVTGNLLPTDQPEVWSQELIRLLGDRETARGMGRLARVRVEAEFAIEAVVDRYEDLYKRLLEGRPLIG